jgi:hypothetical protein
MVQAMDLLPKSMTTRLVLAGIFDDPKVEEKVAWMGACQFPWLAK